MRGWFERWFGGLIVVAATAAACLVFSVVPVSGQAQAPAYKAPRTKDGKADLNGIWEAMSTANWDLRAHAAAQGPVLSLGAQFSIPPGPGVIDGDGTIPYLPAAAEQQKKNSANRLTLDPEIKCYMGGIPRSTYMPYPFQIIQSPKTITMHYEFAGGFRSINMEKATEAPADSWMGWSTGHWEGDTLVVVVTDQNDQTWLDRAGDFHSNAMKVTERYTPRSADVLMYEATIEDAKTFSRPWKISVPLYRHVEKNAQIMEYKCNEFAEELLYGKYRKQLAK
jgi:hypothetical protein